MRRAANPVPLQLGHGLHFVRPTDTVQGIASQYNTTVEEIIRLNNLNAVKGIAGKAYLRVPENTAADTAKQNGGQRYVVYCNLQ